VKGLEEAWRDTEHPVYTNKVTKFINLKYNRIILLGKALSTNT
jgi:hypothetical protein